MIPRLLCFTLALFLAINVLGQDAQTPQRLDDLLIRAAQFRKLLAVGDRVKASELVVAAKRKEFLNKPPATLDNVRLAGLEFIDKDHVLVRVTGQSLVSGGAGAQLTEPQVADLWVREKGGWFLQPDSETVPFSGMFKKDAAADATALAEIKSSFKLLTQSIDLGEMWQGDHKDVQVQFQYDGNAAIRIVSKVDTPVTMIDSASTQSITKDSKQFKIVAGSDDFEGSFDIPVAFTVYYKSVALDESVRVRGKIRPICKYRQVPDLVPPDSKEEFRLFLTNNTNQPADVPAIFTEGKFYVLNSPHHLAAGEEGIITLRRDLTAKPPGGAIMLSIDNDKDKRSCTVRIH